VIQVRTTRWPDERRGGEWRTRIRLPINELARAWAQFLGRIPWAAMVTLTFDLKRVFPVRRARASREAWWWCCSLGGIFRRPVAWLYVTERGRSGAWHAHALVAGLSVAEVNVAAEMWRVGRGIADVRDVWKGDGAVLYVAKGVPYRAEIAFSETIEVYRDRLRDDSIIQLRDEVCPCPAGGVARGSLRPSVHCDGTDSRLATSSSDRMDGHCEGLNQSSGLDSDLLERLIDGYLRELQPRRSR